MRFVQLVELPECHRVRTGGNVFVYTLGKLDGDALVRCLLKKVVGEVVYVGVYLDA